MKIELTQALKTLPHSTPPPWLSRRIIADLPRYHGLLGGWQYALLRPRQLPPTTMGRLFLLAALLHLLLALFLQHILPPAHDHLHVSAWLAWQPSLLTILAIFPLLAAFQVTVRRHPPLLLPTIVYFLVMTGNALYPLLIQQNLFLGLTALWLLLPSLLLGGLPTQMRCR